MRKFILITATFLFAVVFSCKEETTTSEPATETAAVEITHTIEGVWQLTSFINYDSDGNADTIPATDTNKQIKMYSKNKIMWSRFNAQDSVDWFGYGDYTVADNELVETIEYGSKSMNKAIEESAVFTFDLVLDANTFSQISLDEDGHAIFAENYIRIEE